MAEFHETRMGQQFYDKTMPALVKAIERMNCLLEQLVDQRRGGSDRES